MPILDHIEHPQLLWVNVVGPNGATRLYIFAGIAVFNWHVTNDDNWTRNHLHISMLLFDGVPRIFEDQVVDHVETASLASIYSRETGKRDAVGFAVDSVRAFFTTREDEDPANEPTSADFGIDVQLALRGNDVRLYRVSFQLNISSRV